MRINVFNPYAAQILERGMTETLGNTGAYYAPFLQLLGARWVCAVEQDVEQDSRTITSIEEADSDTVVLHDWFIYDFTKTPEMAREIERFKGSIYIFTDVPQRQFDFPNKAKNIAKNLHVLDRKTAWGANPPEVSYSLYRDKPGYRTPIVPLGCSQSWLPHKNHKDPVIFFDEPHKIILESLSDDNNINVVFYKHALKTAQVLAERGFQLVTFCREESELLPSVLDNYPIFSRINEEGWIPFSRLAEHYSSASMFFSYVGETFGYASFENLQLGNGIIAYSEHRNPYDFRQMQNSALISIYMQPELAADVICEFFQRFEKQDLRTCIRNNAYRKFSTETFMPRLRNELL